MSQILNLPRNCDSLRDGAGSDRGAAPQKNQRLRCSYTNTTRQIQIARISDITYGYFEQVVFPGGYLQFEAMPEAHLEIHTGTIVSAILTDKIPCTDLRITQASTGKRVQ